MANINADVLRVCLAAATLATTLREKQLGFETDTFKLVFKAPGGSHYDYAALGTDANYANLTITEYLYHGGNTDTYLRFETDKISVFAGTVEMLTLTEDTQDVFEVNAGQADVDTVINTNGLEAFSVDGSTSVIRCGKSNLTTNYYATLNSLFEFGGTDSTYRMSLICNSDTDAHFTEFNMMKSHHDTWGTLGATGADDVLGQISFRGVGSGATIFVHGAAIAAVQSAASGASYAPADLIFYACTNAAMPEIMRIKGTGQVIVGAPDTADAVPLLRVWGGTAGAVDSIAGTVMTIENDDTCYLQFLSPNNKGAGLWFGDPDDSNIGAVYYNHASDVLYLRAGDTNLVSVSSSILNVDGELQCDTLHVDTAFVSGAPTAEGYFHMTILVCGVATDVHVPCEVP